MTNAEELAENIDDMAVAIAEGGCPSCAYRKTKECHYSDKCVEGIKKWLEQEA